MHTSILQKLTTYTKCKFIHLTQSGDQAIMLAIEAVKKISSKLKFLVPDQGGWLSYIKYPKKLNFEVIQVKTDCGIIDLDDLREKLNNSSALIYQNPAGYFAEQPTKQIYEICKNKCLVIEDITGSIGDLELCDYLDADFLVCSFGKWKPINLGYGGFISTNNEEYFSKIDKDLAKFDEKYLPELLGQLENLNERMKKFYELNKKIKDDLKNIEIIHREKKGINVIVKYKEEIEKEKIIKYCQENKLEFTLCPRYIRVNEKAISIEVKRLTLS